MTRRSGCRIRAALPADGLYAIQSALALNGYVPMQAADVLQ